MYDLLNEIGIMLLNNAGKMIENEWLQLPQRFSNISLRHFIVMPNHFHAILEIVEPAVGATLVVAPDDKTDIKNNQICEKHITKNNVVVSQIESGQPQGIAPTRKTIGNIMNAFKSITTVKYINGVKNNNWLPFNKNVWQRNYYEHIIRNEESYMKISDYIFNNPSNWDNDSLK